jgi:uncharacterized protein YndB with AHSA1/START domain
MMTTNPATITLPTDEQILITCHIPGPRHLVYKAWTTPELVQRWWAGDRGTMTTVEIDLRTGGRWRYVLNANGHEVAFHGEYREIVPDTRIVTTEVFEMPGAELPPELEPINTITFTDAEDGTGTIVRILGQTANKDMRDMILNSGMESGMQEQFVHLADVVTSLASSLEG